MSLVARLSPQFAVCELCQAFEIERSSYYQMRQRRQGRNTRRDRLRARLVTLHARRLVGWALGDKLDSNLTCRTLSLAFEARGRPDVLRYLTSYYNQLRLHSSNGYRTPMGAEAQVA